jgi:thioredoxin
VPPTIDLLWFNQAGNAATSVAWVFGNHRPSTRPVHFGGRRPESLAGSCFRFRGRRFGMSQDGAVVDITDQNVDQMLRSSGLTVVEFSAAWSGPGRLLNPAVEQIASEYAGRVVVGKVDVDQNQRIEYRFGVTSLPTILFFRNGQLVDRLVGAVPTPALKAKVDALLA